MLQKKAMIYIDLIQHLKLKFQELFLHFKIASV